MRKVTMFHPELDTTIEVAETAVPHHERSGWERVQSLDAAPPAHHAEATNATFGESGGDGDAVDSTDTDQED